MTGALHGYLAAIFLSQQMEDPYAAAPWMTKVKKKRKEKRMGYYRETEFICPVDSKIILYHNL